MPYESFHNRFPELAKEETRSITLIDSPDFPDDTYGLMESYCNEQDCDCRRVLFSVLAAEQQKIMAVIAFGWESRAYYAKWLVADDPQLVKELQGPILNLASPQSRFAPKLLKLVNDLILQDKKYIQRLKAHYRLFKEDLAKELQDKSNARNGTVVPILSKVGRNMPCPCGSGKKYKKCCLPKG